MGPTQQTPDAAAQAAGYYTYRPPQSELTIHLSLDALEGILADVLTGFGSIPRRGAEVGGILVGRADEKEIWIEDFATAEGHGMLKVWMSHGDKVTALPPGFALMASTPSCPIAGMADEARAFYGVQFHPEVTHTLKGRELLDRFVLEICGARPDWVMGSYIDEAVAKAKKLAAEAAKDSPSERSVVERDLKLEALSRVLRREIPWRQHCHRADDIATAMRMAREFGYNLVIDHGTEAYLLADQIAAASIPVIIGPLFTSRSKVELRNRSLANPGRLAAAGVMIAITTDHPVVPIHFLIHQATLAVKEGLDPVTALRAVTVNPARIIGCADRIGSVSPGKDADLVIWSGDPLDVMSRAERAFVDGREIYRYDYGRREGVFADV